MDEIHLCPFSLEVHNIQECPLFTSQVDNACFPNKTCLSSCEHVGPFKCILISILALSPQYVSTLEENLPKASVNMVLSKYDALKQEQ